MLAAGHGVDNIIKVVGNALTDGLSDAPSQHFRPVQEADADRRMTAPAWTVKICNLSKQQPAILRLQADGC